MTGAVAAPAGLEAIRRYFAEEVEVAAGLQTPGLVDALAMVPRERFLGPGPWIMPAVDEAFGPPRRTPDADPRRVYHNVSIAIDRSRQLYNGQPSILARWIDVLGLSPGARLLHIGCGTGYYTAIAAHLVGPGGRVRAIEIDEELAARARQNLEDLACVDVVTGDGTSPPAGPFDAILVNAGVTHAHPAWLDALAPGGRLLMPLTFSVEQMPSPISKGVAVLLTSDEHGHAVRLLSMVAIYSSLAVRDPVLNDRLRAAMTGGAWHKVRRLRRDAHAQEPACWLHGDGFCLSA
jgi:protein-L-isoaspartate(D-aspartate) O-methyltransferase